VTIRFLQYPWLIICCCVFIFGVYPVHGQESLSTEEWDITADRIIRFDDPLSVVAEGNIELVKRRLQPPPPPKVEEEITEWSVLLEEEPEISEPTPEDVEAAEQEPQYITEITVKADWVAYDMALGVIRARGNISVVTDEEQLYAEQATINLEQETGSFKQATIIRDTLDMHLEGAVIEKTGYRTYHIEDGWVITCKVEEGETAPWSFAAKDAVIEQDGYATLKHARFRVKDVPLLYSPYLIVPVKTKRQTGFLLPELGASKNNGFSFNLPFFWNISDSADMTIYTEYMVNRGYMPGLEFRYVKEDTDFATFMANYLYDNLTDPSETDYYQSTGFTHDNKDRYWLRGKANHDFGGGWTSRLDVDVVSDRDYLTEFNTGITGFSSSNDLFLEQFGRSLENRTDDQRTNNFGVLKSWGPMSLTGNFLAINDVRADKSGDSPLWNLPSIDFTGALPLESFGNLTFEWDTDYVNFWREEGVGGHRFDIYPRLSAPVPLGSYLESRAEVGVRDTFYNVQTYGDATWDDSDSQNRLLFDVNTEVATTLMRVFALSGEGADGFRHELRPYVGYVYVPDVDQTDLPIYDSVDRISQENQFAYGIDNFFDLMNGTSTARDYGSFKIRQSYSLIDTDSDEPFSDINMRLRMEPLLQFFLDYRTDLSVYGNGFVRHDLEGRYTNSRGDRFGLQYVLDDTDGTEQINALVESVVFANWSTRFSIEHSLADKETNEANLALIYQALCWSVEFAGSYTPSDNSIWVLFRLANIGVPIGFSY
jgi:LPS-assembly protein